VSDVVPNDATGYVAAAYIFFLAIVLVYIAIIGAKLERIGRELGELNERIEGRPDPAVPVEAEPAPETEGEKVG
jgi:hypothetical protein